MEFDNWKSSNEIKDNGRYGWKLGSNAQAQFKKHLDDEGGDLFDATVKQRFVSMFDKNQSMMGINVLGIDTVNKNTNNLSTQISRVENKVTKGQKTDKVKYYTPIISNFFSKSKSKSQLKPNAFFI